MARTKNSTTPTPTPVVEETAAPVEATVSVFDQFSEFMAKLQAVSAQMSSLRTEFRSLERQVSKDLKAAAKVNQKRKRKSGNRAPSGFVKPTLISNELAAFLGKPEGTEMARTEVTREINAYIRAHSLQDKDNGRKIIPDAKLKGLLKLKKGDELTYFNLQKYMSPHFAKAADKAAAAAAAGTA
jgi:upstream activation factor subunit UAF30